MNILWPRKKHPACRGGADERRLVRETRSIPSIPVLFTCADFKNTHSAFIMKLLQEEKPERRTFFRISGYQ